MFEQLVTHSGLFHADDVFAAATMRKLAPMASLIRTRDPEILAAVTKDPRTVVFDVGDAFDPSMNNFDHHQRGFDRAREENQIPFAAFGLVWETYGYRCCEAVLARDEHAPDEQTLGEVTARVERELVWAIDAADCGAIKTESHLADAPEVSLRITSISRVVAMYNPTGRHPAHIYDAAFEQILDVASTLLEAQIHAALAYVHARHVVEEHDDGSPIMILDEYVPWNDHINDHHRFVLSPAMDGSGWMVETVQEGYTPRCAFPQSWGGMRGEELASVSGVEDAIFCHRALFIAAAKSREGALKLAHLALDAGD